MEHSYFNLMLYLFQEHCKQPEGYKVGLLNIHMIEDKTIQQTISGADPGGGGGPGAPPPPKIGKNIIFWPKIVIFHTNYPKNFRASLRSAHFF